VGSDVLRVLVVEDSRSARHLIVSILKSDPDIRVVGEAENGTEGVRMAAELSPDVITMDIAMPEMNGLDATRRIMERNPIPIVMVTASYASTDAQMSFRALEAGAITVVDKPLGPASPDFEQTSRILLDTVKLMADVVVVTRRPRRDGPTIEARPLPLRDRSERVALVAIGASTGGPAALAKLLRALPGDLPVPVVVAQHISPGFERSLADWLDGDCDLRVRLPSHGERLVVGEVLIAPEGRHLGVTRAGRVALSDDDPVGQHRPSVTYLFRSVAEAYGSAAIGVILTGMGADGAEGALALRRAGGLILAQDEPSSVVYGMAREAVALGAVDQLGAPEQLGAIIADAVTPGAR
jgi:two-component system chemotaxis response regulator CheB